MALLAGSDCVVVYCELGSGDDDGPEQGHLSGQSNVHSPRHLLSPS